MSKLKTRKNHESNSNGLPSECDDETVVFNLPVPSSATILTLHHRDEIVNTEQISSRLGLQLGLGLVLGVGQWLEQSDHYDVMTMYNARVHLRMPSAMALMTPCCSPWCNSSASLEISGAVYSFTSASESVSPRCHSLSDRHLTVVST